jgi:hypothetical protein
VVRNEDGGRGVSDGGLQVVPLDFEEANEYVRRFHRHHKPIPGGYKFCLGVARGPDIVGVAIVGLPLAKARMDGFTLEVRRTCTDGTKNVNSMLYGACWRVARGLGYKRLITYTLPSESGVSLRGAGFRMIGETNDARGWNRPKRPRVDTHPLVSKLVWEASQ